MLKIYLSVLFLAILVIGVFAAACGAPPSTSDQAGAPPPPSDLRPCSSLLKREGRSMLLIAANVTELMERV